MTLLVLCAAALTGLIAGELTQLNTGALTVAAALATLGAVLARHSPTHRLLACACIAASLGGLRTQLPTHADPDPLANFSGLPVSLTGEVASLPTRTERAVRFTLRTQAINQQPVHTRVLIIADPDGDPNASPGNPQSPSQEQQQQQQQPQEQQQTQPQPQLGDTITVQGTLHSNASGAPPRMLLYPRITIVEPTSGGLLQLGAQLRQHAIEHIQGALPEPQASLAAGVLLGGSGRLSPDFRVQLQRSGLAHIVAIDGYKQVLVSAAFGWLAVRLIGRPIAAAPIIVGILGYTLLTGARPSAVRAGIMAGLGTTAAVAGRVADPLTSCLLAAVVMAGWDPEIIRDVGFQLSFSATLGLILVWPKLGRMLRRTPRLIAEPAGITLAVTIATLPVMLTVFGSVSLVSPMAHIVAMPLLPPVILAAALLGAAPPWPPLTQALALLAWLPTTALAETVRISGSLPGAALSTGRLPAEAAAACSALLLGWGVWELPEVAPLRERVAKRLARADRRFAPVAFACLSTVALIAVLAMKPDQRVHAYPLSVWPGEAVLIRGPTGTTALVASGRVDRYALPGAVAEQLAVWEHALDAVVPLDADAEARLGPLLERFPTRELAVPGAEQRIPLHGGAVLDVYADGAASVSYGSDWLRVMGQPPQPEDQERSP